MSEHPRRIWLVFFLALGVTTPVLASEPEARIVSEREVIALALANNPTLAVSLTELRRARELVRGEEARYGFVLQLDEGATHSKSPSLTADSVTIPHSDRLVLGGELSRHLVLGTDVALRLEGSWQKAESSSFVQPGTMVEMGPGYGSLVRLRLSQPLLQGAGRDVNEAKAQSARVALSQAEAAKNRASSELLQSVLTAYWELYYAGQTVEIQRQSLELAGKQRDDSAARVRTGTLAPVEVLAFETRVATLAEDLALAESEVRRRQIELAALVSPPDKPIALATAAGQVPPIPNAPTGELRSSAVASSQQLAELREAIRQTELAAKNAAEPYRPSLNLDGYVQLQGLGNDEVAPAFEQVGKGQAFSAYLGLVYRTPLSSTHKDAESARAHLAVESARRQLDAATAKVIADLDVSTARDRATRQRLILSEQTLEIAKKQVAAEEARFATGSVTALEVSAAQDQLRAVQLRVLRASVDLVQTHYAIQHLSGSLLSEYAAVAP